MKAKKLILLIGLLIMLGIVASSCMGSRVINTGSSQKGFKRMRITKKGPLYHSQRKRVKQYLEYNESGY